MAKRNKDRKRMVIVVELSYFSILCGFCTVFGGIYSYSFGGVFGLLLFFVGVSYHDHLTT